MKAGDVWLLLMCGTSFLTSALSSPVYCSVDDLKPGLKYNGTMAGPRSVKYGDIMSVLCYDIFLKSTSIVICRGPGNWTKEIPPCEPILCASPPPVRGGRLSLTGWMVGNELTLTCDEGFWYNSTNPRICQHNGSWTGEPGHCQAVRCLPLPAPYHGRFSPGPPYKYGNKIKVSCDKGFVYTGSLEHVCGDKNMWDGTVGECLREDLVRCPMDIPENTLVTPDMKEGQYKSEINITCPIGSIYNGTQTRICQANGTWSGSAGECNVVTCMPLQSEVDITAQNGTEFISLLLNHSIPANHSRLGNISVRAEYGDTVEVKCPEGYVYNGSLLRCNEDGHWEGRKGSCQGVACHDNPVISHGSLEGSGHVFPNKANISCSHGYQWEGSIPHAECTSDGTWKVTGQCQAGKMDTIKIGLVVSAVITLLVVLLAGTLLIRQSRITKALERHRTTQREREVKDPEKVPLIEKHGNTDDPIREAVLERGHVINRNPDKKINLDNQFVQLRVVTGEGYDRMDEINDALPDRYQDYLQRAGAENIEIKDILNHVKEETVDGVRKRKPLLMEGRAGVGKSTLVQKLMRMWAQNKWAKDYKAAFLFNIRNLTVLDKRQITLEELFMHFSIYSLKAGTPSATKSMFLEEEEHILIFLDGMDEFPRLEEYLNHGSTLKVDVEAEPIEWCIHLLLRRVLGKSTLIIASRPFKSLKHVNCSPVLEVVGLTRDSIMDFIDHHVAADHIERVRASMESNQLVMSVSAITYFCMMFCKVLEKDENVSMTELTTYTRIAAFFIQHYMSRCPSVHNLEIQPVTSYLQPLASLAYRGLVDRHSLTSRVRLVFDQTDLQETGITETIRKVAEDSGILLTSNINLSNESAGYLSEASEFVHLSIQELLAMLELLYKSEIIARSVASMMWESGSFLMAQQYLFGLCYDEESQDIQNLTDIMAEGKEKRKKKHRLIPDLIERLSNMDEDPSTSSKLLAIQMTYETQRPDVAQSVAPVLFKDSEVLSLSGTLLTAVDVNATVYLLSNTDRTYGLRLENVTMDVTCVNVMAQNLKRCKSLKGLILTGCSLSVTGIKVLLTALPQVDTLMELKLDHVGLCENTEDDVGNALKQMPNLTQLSLEGSCWSKPGTLSLGKALLKFTSLTELSLANAGLDDGKIGHIIAAMKVINTMKMSLSGNKFGKQGIEHLADWLKDDTSLQHLNLANTGMGDDLVEILLAAVKTNKTLEALDIRGEKMEYDILGLLDGNTTLSTLWYTGANGDTWTMIAVTGTNRRMEVSAEPNGTHFFSWCLQDLVTSSALLHPHTVWSERSSDLYLELTEQYTHHYTELYGAERPPDTTDTWCHTLNQLTSSTHRVGELVVFLSNSASLSPLLSSLTHDVIHTLIHSQVGKVQVCYGEVTCSDLLTWLSSLSSQPGWSVSGHTNGARVTNTEGQSIMIILKQSRVVSSHQQQQQYKAYLMNETGLLYKPEWIRQ